MLCTVQCRPAAACARYSPPRGYTLKKQEKTRQAPPRKSRAFVLHLVYFFSLCIARCFQAVSFKLALLLFANLWYIYSHFLFLTQNPPRAIKPYRSSHQKSRSTFLNHPSTEKIDSTTTSPHQIDRATFSPSTTPAAAGTPCQGAAKRSLPNTAGHTQGPWPPFASHIDPTHSIPCP